MFGDPNLYVNFNENIPTASNFSLRCGFYGEDFCVISSAELKGKANLTIGVNCVD